MGSRVFMGRVAVPRSDAFDNADAPDDEDEPEETDVAEDEEPEAATEVRLEVAVRVGEGMLVPATSDASPLLALPVARATGRLEEGGLPGGGEGTGTEEENDADDEDIDKEVVARLGDPMSSTVASAEPVPAASETHGTSNVYLNSKKGVWGCCAL